MDNLPTLIDFLLIVPFAEGNFPTANDGKRDCQRSPLWGVNRSCF